MYSKLNADTVQVSINHLSFFGDAPIYQRDDVSKLFVEYRFLGVAPEETETPYALPKPKPDVDINFNFTKSKAEARLREHIIGSSVESTVVKFVMNANIYCIYVCVCVL